MDETLKAILDSLPPKPTPVRLEPYRDLIFEMRRRGWTYREIAQVLAERCQVRAELAAIYEVLHPRQKRRVKPAAQKERPQAKANTLPASARKTEPAATRLLSRVAKPEERPVEPSKTGGRVFEYDEEEPLRLISDSKKRA